MKLASSLLLALALAGCTKTVTVVKEVPVEVRVPVSAPCMGEKPNEVVNLNQKVDQAHWNELGTDQRDALIGAQGMSRKVYGEKLTVAASGCP